MALTHAAQERLAKDEALYKKRHSLAHIMAEAVLQLFPDGQIAIGPPVDNGFYYDFELSRSLKPEDLEAIELKMKEIIKTRSDFIRKAVSKAEARQVLEGQIYKQDLLDKLPDDEEISLYYSNAFVDLCRGPHVDNMGVLDSGSFKLAKIAGAYWRGDEKGPMLQRIYAYCFHNGPQLKEYLQFLEEAERRDHRRLGKDLDLFHIDDDNPGQIYWHPDGWTIYRSIEDYVRNRLRIANYQEVKTPSVMPKSLWERSGHWAKYRDHMFVTESEKREFALKPMNCPGHIEIFRQGIKSYRDLPLRMAEFGSCCRNEASGALHGIMRVRGFVQDDAHIFCTEEQVQTEVKDFCELLSSMYADFGFTGENVLVRLALRPEVRLGDDQSWDRAESALGLACKAAGFDYLEAPGEGAFYGPKLEFTLIDALGRKWQCGTIQLDYQLPSKERLDAGYIDNEGVRRNPVMLHRAVLGSLERFIGILIEHFSGSFPVWLAPTQVVVIPVGPDFEAGAQKIAEALKAEGLRCLADLSEDRMQNKIRKHQAVKVPYMLIIGAKELETGTVSIRTRTNEQANAVALSDFIVLAKDKIASKEGLKLL